MDIEFKKGWLITSIKKDNIIYMVSKDDGNNLHCVSLCDRFYYSIPKEDARFCFCVELLDSYGELC